MPNKIESVIRRKLNALLKGAVTQHAQEYIEAVTAAQTTPVGSGKRHGDIHKGETVERSQPGEFPRREFGDAVRGIRTAFDRSGLSAASGVTQKGMPLIHLAYGHHYRSGEAFERLGPVDIWYSKQPNIVSAAKEAANQVK